MTSLGYTIKKIPVLKELKEFAKAHDLSLKSKLKDGKLEELLTFIQTPRHFISRADFVSDGIPFTLNVESIVEDQPNLRALPSRLAEVDAGAEKIRSNQQPQPLPTPTQNTPNQLQHPVRMTNAPVLQTMQPQHFIPNHQQLTQHRSNPPPQLPFASSTRPNTQTLLNRPTQPMPTHQNTYSQLFATPSNPSAHLASFSQQYNTQHMRPEFSIAVNRPTISMTPNQTIQPTQLAQLQNQPVANPPYPSQQPFVTSTRPATSMSPPQIIPTQPFLAPFPIPFAQNTQRNHTGV